MEAEGGDEIGLDFKLSAQSALDNIQTLEKSSFPELNLLDLRKKIIQSKVLVSDQELPVSEERIRAKLSRN